MLKSSIFKQVTKGVGPNVNPEAFYTTNRKVFLFGSPSYTNIGDQAIAYAIERFVKNHFPYYEYIEIMDYATDEGIRLVQSVIKDDDIVCYTGGGNLGNLYMPIEEDRRKVIDAFKDYRTIVFPQSAFYEDTEEGEKEKEKTQEIFHSHPNLVLVARENQTFDLLKETFQNQVLYTPDMVLSLNIEPKHLSREGILFILRADKEKVTEEALIEELMEYFSATDSVTRMDTVLSHIDTLDYGEREEEFMKVLDQIASSKLVITDRLHAMIFSIITRTPCIVFGNSYGKAKHSYHDWLEELHFIEYTDEKDIEALKPKFERLMKAERNTLDLKDDFQVLRDFFKDKKV